MVPATAPTAKAQIKPEVGVPGRTTELPLLLLPLSLRRLTLSAAEPVLSEPLLPLLSYV